MKTDKKRYKIKYEDTSGDCHVEVIYAYNKVDVGRRLSYPVREVYWIKEDKEPVTENLKHTLMQNISDFIKNKKLKP